MIKESESPIKEYLGILIDYSRDALLNEKGLTMLTKKGFYKKEWEESPQETFARAATCYCFGDYEFAQRMYDYMSLQHFVNASPVQTNAQDIEWPTFTKEEFEQAGDWLEENIIPDGMPISCFLVYNGSDTKKGLVDARNESNWLSMLGGGLGVYMGNRSPDEKSTGVMAHLKGYDADALSYKQTESRRGSIAAYLDVDHPEIMSFLEMRSPTGGDANKKCFNLNNAVNLPDAFMEATIREEEYELKDPKHGYTGRKLKAPDVWDVLMDMRFETGEPLINFTDTVNRNKPSWITKPTYEVKQSNLCVAPETMLLTRQGYVPIAELEDCVLDIWNGEEWSEVSPQKTGENQKLFKVTTSAGQTLECTEYHKWYVFTDYGKPFVKKRTHELKHGDKLMKFDLPVIEGEKELPYAYDNGFYSGDGCFMNGGTWLYLYHEKKALKDFLPSVKNWRDHAPNNRLLGKGVGLKDKFFVPTNEYSIKSRLDWFAGYLDADGCVYRNGTNEAITASSVNLTFLQEVQLMLQTLGVSCKISKLYDAGIKQLPANDGTGLSKDYMCQESYRLLITSYDSFKLVSLGLKTNRLKIDLRRPQRDAKQFNKIVSVIDEGRYDDTWCFIESKRGMGMFNGILTGNCSEITLMTSNKRTAVCCLSSLNLAKYDEWKDSTIIEDLVRYLDNVLEYFIRLAPPELNRAVYSAMKERAIGIGTLGLHSLLQKTHIAFESSKAASLNYNLYKTIQQLAIKASKVLAEERGECPDCLGSGMRNSHLIAIAPNASSSEIAGESPSIEPWAANCFNGQGRAGSFLIKNPHLKNYLALIGKDTKEVWSSILENDGSVQHLDFLDEETKNVYKTFAEIDQQWVIEHAGIRQPFICQSQSVNIKVKKDITRQQFSDLHMLAWSKGLKTLYYCRAEGANKTSIVRTGSPLNQVQVDIDFSVCKSCEG